MVTRITEFLSHICLNLTIVAQVTRSCQNNILKIVKFVLSATCWVELTVKHHCQALITHSNSGLQVGEGGESKVSQVKTVEVVVW